MKSASVKLVGCIVLVGAVLLVTLAACSGSKSATTAPTPTVPTATPTATATPSATAAATAIAPPLPPAPSTSPSTSDLLARGKLIFEKTAGGVGCAYCHGLGAKGDGGTGLGAPDIRGQLVPQIAGAVRGGVPLMSFIQLSDSDIEAVAAYLQYLNAQP